ncbi:MAG: hypothetical protein KZQ71_01910 [Candidatus Thiodiazotropha sp. (ex Lucinoma aequizonata)]|nr:hypothetical protein [Candidatus Thiodiazotropha sp. (ex Lucinoma aequizonata)]
MLEQRQLMVISGASCELLSNLVFMQFESSDDLINFCHLNTVCNYSAALYLRLLNSHLIGFLALAKERVRLLPFGWHPGTQLLGAHLNSYHRL